MTKNPTWLLVVAAAIHDAEGRLLLQQRAPGKHHELLWEFPGGKVEAEENPRLALAREIAEELAIELPPAAMRPLGFADEPGDEETGGVVLILYDCPGWTGTACGLEGQAFGWFTPAEAAALDLAPMDRQLLGSSLH